MFASVKELILAHVYLLASFNLIKVFYVEHKISRRPFVIKKISKSHVLKETSSAEGATFTF